MEYRAEDRRATSPSLVVASLMITSAYLTAKTTCSFVAKVFAVNPLVNFDPVDVIENIREPLNRIARRHALPRGLHFVARVA